MKKIIIHTDGGARGNPGPAGIGAVIMDENERVVKEISEYIGKNTNNFAEYEALIRALTITETVYGKKLETIPVDVCMDSELVVRQLTGLYKVKDPILKEQFKRVQRLLHHFPHINFTHVRREKNTHADQLVNQAIDLQS